jgi:hypothetical protein
MPTIRDYMHTVEAGQEVIQEQAGDQDVKESVAKRFAKKLHAGGPGSGRRPLNGGIHDLLMKNGFRFKGNTQHHALGQTSGKQNDWTSSYHRTGERVHVNEKGKWYHDDRDGGGTAGSGKSSLKGQITTSDYSPPEHDADFRRN